MRQEFKVSKYVAFYKNKKAFVAATGSYEAQIRAATIFGVPRKNLWKITVGLTDQNVKLTPIPSYLPQLWS